MDKTADKKIEALREKIRREAEIQALRDRIRQEAKKK